MNAKLSFVLPSHPPTYLQRDHTSRDSPTFELSAPLSPNKIKMSRFKKIQLLVSIY